MRIVHMTSVHPWDDNRIFNKMCRFLASQGNDVHLVAAMSERYDGKIIDGVTLHAVNTPVNRRERFLKTTPAVLEKAQLINGDLYHFHDPEFLPYISKFRSKALKPVIYDVHEDYPAAILSKGWVPKLYRPILSKIVNVLEKKMVTRVDGVILAWPKIIDRFPKHSLKVLINNYPYLKELQPIENKAIKRERGMFVYVGGLSPIRGVLEIIKAIALGGGQYKLILGGNWESEAYKQKCQTEPGWTFCEYRGFLSRKDMRDVLATVQAGLIAFFPEPNHRYSVPNKIFEYISAGLPVIASDLPMQRSIVEETGCGVVADARSPLSIFEKMQWIYNNADKAAEMGNAGRRAVEEKFNWESEAKKLKSFYEEILNRKNITSVRLTIE